MSAGASAGRDVCGGRAVAARSSTAIARCHAHCGRDRGRAEIDRCEGGAQPAWVRMAQRSGRVNGDHLAAANRGRDRSRSVHSERYLGFGARYSPRPSPARRPQRRRSEPVARKCTSRGGSRDAGRDGRRGQSAAGGGAAIRRHPRLSGIGSSEW